MRKICFLVTVLLIMTICSPMVVTASSNLPLPDGYPGTGSEFGDEAIVVRVDDGVLETVVDSRFPEETFSPQDRKYVGISTITKTGNRLWATWRTGGTDEGRDNYFPLCYSEDGGKTWVDPYIVIDHPDKEDKGIGVGTPYLWTAPDGKMWLFYLQQGLWAIVFDGAAGDLSQMTWDIRQISTTLQISKKPIVIEGENGKQELFMIAYNPNIKSETYSYVSTDNGETWQIRGTAVSTSPFRKYVEAGYVQLSDGSILQMCRLDNGGGGMEVSVSRDYGKTWSAFECNLEEPYWGPGSKPDILKLSDGGILMINHDNKNSRSGLTAYLSYDDGKTWEYRLTLDERGGATADYFDGVAYPEAYQDENGDIFVIYDRDRWTSCEIRLAKFTVDDVKKGCIAEEDSFLKKPVFKKAEYKDIVSVETSFAQSSEYIKGVSSDDIISGLPTKITVTDDTGMRVTLTGEWVAPRAFKEDKEGEFVFTFEGNIPEGMYDTFQLLTHKAIIQEGTGGCSSVFNGGEGLLLFGIGIAALCLIFAKKKKENI